MATKRRIEASMATAAWGEWHTDALLRVNLPALLAPGNLPAFLARHELAYTIYTRPRDVARIARAPAVEALRKLMSVEIQTCPEIDSLDPITAHHRVWRLAYDAARGQGSFMLFLPPDVTWAQGAFGHLAELLASGKNAIFMNYPRVVCETFVPALLRAYGREPEPLAVPARAMMRLVLAHLHPLMPAYFRESRNFPIHPELMLWAVPGEGLLMRMLSREMFLFDPSRLSLTEQLLLAPGFEPDEIHVVNDSDDLLGVSLAPLGKDAAWHRSARDADPVAIARWGLDNDSPMNDLLVGINLRLHATEPNEGKWRRAEWAADQFLRRAVIAREALRVFRAAREMGCVTASQVLGAALELGVVPRAVLNRGHALVFLPNDEAMARFPKPELWAMLKPAGRKDLVRFLRRHLVFLGEEKEPGKKAVRWRNAAGETVVLRESVPDILTVDSAKVLAQKRLPHCTVCVIDRVLGQRPRRDEPGGEFPDRKMRARF